MRRLLQVSSALLAFITPGWAIADPVRADLPPMTFGSAELSVRDSQGKLTVYRAADLEKLPTYRLTTTTPWRDQPAVFEGVLLSDLLAAHDLQAAGDITVTAENDFVSLFSPEVLNATPILVATRVDGRPHSRRARGPFQFVVDADAFEQSEALEESHLVWMAARIEAGR